jgi:hypothetical protein
MRWQSERFPKLSSGVASSKQSACLPELDIDLNSQSYFVLHIVNILVTTSIFHSFMIPSDGLHGVNLGSVGIPAQLDDRIHAYHRE